MKLAEADGLASFRTEAERVMAKNQVGEHGKSLAECLQETLQRGGISKSKLHAVLLDVAALLVPAKEEDILVALRFAEISALEDAITTSTAMITRLKEQLANTEDSELPGEEVTAEFWGQKFPLRDLMKGQAIDEDDDEAGGGAFDAAAAWAGLEALSALLDLRTIPEELPPERVQGIEGARPGGPWNVGDR
mgnify:CR=1 FL=1